MDKGKGGREEGEEASQISLVSVCCPFSRACESIRMHVRKDGLLGEEEDSFLSSFPLL